MERSAWDAMGPETLSLVSNPLGLSLPHPGPEWLQFLPEHFPRKQEGWSR